MTSIDSEIKRTVDEGYSEADAAAKVCQDIILNAISRTALNNNVTIKGGVVMRSISNNVRRATQDMDIDFIHLSLSDDSINSFIESLDNIDGLKIESTGKITELKQQDYHGKRAYLKITDSLGFSVTTKLDLGVHKHLDIEQDEFCFDISLQNDSVSLLINSKEQMFAEKLRSILKLGTFSTRYKDIFDLCWLSSRVDKGKLMKCLDILIFRDKEMKENSFEDISKRVATVLSNKDFRKKLSSSKKNWLDMENDQACDSVMAFINSFQKM